MEEALAEYLRHLALEKNASAHTVKSYREDLTQALEFFRTRQSGRPLEPAQLNTRLLRAYLAWLHEQGYAKSTIARRIAAVRSWCRFLCRQGTLAANPADGLRGPRQDKKLPHFLSEADIDRLLAAPPGDQPLGLRDRAILETLYSAGLRVSEMTGLELDDRIHLYYTATPALAAALQTHAAYLSAETLAAEITAGPPPPAAPTATDTFEGETFTAALEKHSPADS